MLLYTALHDVCVCIVQTIEPSRTRRRVVRRSCTEWRAESHGMAQRITKAKHAQARTSVSVHTGTGYMWPLQQQLFRLLLAFTNSENNCLYTRHCKRSQISTHGRLLVVLKLAAVVRGSLWGYLRSRVHNIRARFWSIDFQEPVLESRNKGRPPDPPCTPTVGQGVCAGRPGLHSVQTLVKACVSTEQKNQIATIPEPSTAKHSSEAQQRTIR